MTSNHILLGDCTHIMRSLATHSVDFILTDPPYLVDYRPRSGARILNDTGAGAWLAPTFKEAFRVLKADSYLICFCSSNHADRFLIAARQAGFRTGGSFVFIKPYAASMRYVRYQHEQAYLFVKGRPALPAEPIADVRTWSYTGNRLHPTQKPVDVLIPLIEAFSKPGDLVLDPFCGSGSTLVAAQTIGRCGLGIELDRTHFATACHRLNA